MDKFACSIALGSAAALANLFKAPTRRSSSLGSQGGGAARRSRIPVEEKAKASNGLNYQSHSKHGIGAAPQIKGQIL